MNIEQLEYIVEAASKKSLVIAANNLHVSQSAISQAISRLEHELDIKLFDRTRRGTVLTLEGQPVIEKAKEVLRLIQELKYEAKMNADGIEKDLKIAVLPGVMPALVKTLLKYKSNFPNVSIHVSDEISSHIISQLEERLIDIALVSENEILNAKKTEFDFIPLFQGKMMAYVNKNSSLARKKVILPEDLNNHMFVLHKDEFIQRFIHDYSETYGPINILFTTQSIEAISIALQEDFVVTVGYDYSVYFDQYVKLGGMVPVEIGMFPQSTGQFGWAFLKGKQLSITLKKFMHMFELEFYN
jgi:DNA-binding transcriptional LysR family regulator